MTRSEQARPDPPRQFVVTIHGIGPYDPSHAAASRLVTRMSSRLAAVLEPVDFNWRAVVDDRLDDEPLNRLSQSMLEAAHLETGMRSGVVPSSVQAIGFLCQTLLTTSLLAVMLCGLLLGPATAIYVRFAGFGVVGPASLLALRGIAALGILAATAFAFGLAAAGLLRLCGRRRDAATLLRRLVLIVLQPVLPLAAAVADAATRDILLRAAYFLVFYAAVVGGIYWWSPDAAAQWPGLRLGNLSLLAAALMAVAAVGLGVAKAIRTPILLARDIFNYVGDAHQRMLIQQGLDQRVRSAVPAGADVILVGHSLGSVIALDSLCGSDTWASCARVSLVTFGSPIARFFQRFYPDLFFPADAAATVATLQSRAPIVRWLNVYRAGWLRGDPVGQALFPRHGAGIDLPIVQRDRVLMQAHLDYWDDDAVVAAVTGSWMRTLPVVAATPLAVMEEPYRHGSVFDTAHELVQRLVTVCAVVALVLACANTFVVVGDRQSAARAFVDRAVRRGLSAPAMVTHATTTWGYGTDLTFPVQVYAFDFRDRAGAPHHVVFREDESSRTVGSLYFDSPSLRQRLGRKEVERTSARFPVTVLYLEDEPGQVTLADAALRPKAARRAVFEVLYREIGSMFWVIVALLVASYLAVRRAADAILPEVRS